jgi:hypothetical protein
VCLAAGIVLGLWSRGARRAALTAAAIASVVVLPWLAWLAFTPRQTQVGLFPGTRVLAVIAENSLFYVRRLPDMVTGPFVEIGTVFQPGLRVPATIWATIATAVVVWGWLVSLRHPRRRAGGLVALFTLALLFVWPFTEAGRFLIPLVPLILMGAIEGLDRCLRLFGTSRPRRWAVWAALAGSVPYSTYAVITGRAEAGRRTQDPFDQACMWIARTDRRSGPILTRHPGEVFWVTGRTALVPPSDSVESVQQAIERYRVPYLLVDSARYANAPASPLERYVAGYPERVERLWSHPGGVAVFACRSR